MDPSPATGGAGLIRIGCFALIVSLFGPGVVRAAQPAAAPIPPLRIEAVTHDARAPLPAGRRITVRMVGPRGGTAAFHIAGVVADVGMREIAPKEGQTSIYMGTYVVRPGEAARAAAILATLRVGDLELFRWADRPVTVDARPPQAVDRRPQPRADLQNVRPNIVVSYYDAESAVDPAGVRLLVNGQDVTRQAAITETSAVYTPHTPLRAGPVRVQAVVRDRAGNAAPLEWVFEVANPTGLIQSVTLTPAVGLRPGDNLTIVAMGVPAGRASFTVTGSQRTFPMSESTRTPGMYVGSYPVRSGESAGRLSIQVVLRKGAVLSTAAAVATVPIFVPPPGPTTETITVSGGDRRLDGIVVRGRTRPALRVRVLLSLRMPASSSRSTWVRLVEVSALARPDGTWQAGFGPVVPQPPGALFLSAVAVDPLGQRSGPVTAEIPVAPAVAETAPPAPVPVEPAAVTAEPAPLAPVVLAAPPPPTAPVQCPAGHVYTEMGLCMAPVSVTEGKVAPPPPPEEEPEDSTPGPGKGKGKGKGKKGPPGE
jgi:hypothetical protein